jgi:uncharacterized repeat protein (TIGR04052 family)
MRTPSVALSCVYPVAVSACGVEETPDADGGMQPSKQTQRAEQSAASSRTAVRPTSAPSVGATSGTHGTRAGTGGTGLVGSATIGRAGGASPQRMPDASVEPPAPSDADDAGSPAEVQPIEIRFSGKLGDRPLTCTDTYTLPALGDAKVSVSDFRFFVQEVRLVTADGREEPVTFDDRAPVQTGDVAVIDFTDASGSCGDGGSTAQNTKITGRVKAGAYSGIVFVNGVPESVNHQDIFSANPPLDDFSTYWGWAIGYRFMLMAVTVEPSATSFVHVGSEGCISAQGGYKCSRPNRNRIQLDNFDPAKSTIVADLAGVFSNLDLTSPVECHSSSSSPCATAYGSVGINTTNGQPRDEQSVFRVE